MNCEISALFVQPEGCYKGVDGIDPWDEERDARKYNGSNTVIAHPPCQKWGKMAPVNWARWGGEHNRIGNDGGCFKSALKSVEKWGGVLEHPGQTIAWATFGLDKPIKGHWTASRLGWVCEVWQSAYGHRANKSTWLYYVGLQLPYDLKWNRPVGSHQVGCPDKRGKARNKPVLNKAESNATPVEFRDELIKLAIHASEVK
jgi:hypothetical protein